MSPYKFEIRRMDGELVLGAHTSRELYDKIDAMFEEASVLGMTYMDAVMANCKASFSSDDNPVWVCHLCCCGHQFMMYFRMDYYYYAEHPTRLMGILLDLTDKL